MILRLTRFYAHESCGQCTPCREGCNWMEMILHRIEHGQGRPGDLDLLASLPPQINLRTLCPLGDAACGPVDRPSRNSATNSSTTSPWGTAWPGEILGA